MLKKMKPRFMGATGLLLAFALSGCGALSKVDEQGRADPLVWPDAKDATFKTGSYPDPRALRIVRSGMTKDLLYDLLGRPHFSEGLVNVREWDYLFHFQTSSEDRICQYKVLFDKDNLARNFYWLPESCADVLKDPTAIPEAKGTDPQSN